MPGRTIEIHTERDIVAARKAGRDAARQLGFGPADQTRLTAAIQELARNAIQHGGGGVCKIAGNTAGGLGSVQVVVEDGGPGIPEAKKAVEEGYSTRGGLGAGLAAARRLVHDFQIESRPGRTRVTISITHGEKS